MIRAPVANTVLSSAFEELAGPRAGPGVTEALELRAVSSKLLWLLACGRARRAFTAALERADAAAVEAHVTHFGELVRLGQKLTALGALRPVWLQLLVQKAVGEWFSASVRQGLDAGLVVPGSTKGIHARRLLQIRMDPSVAELMAREQAHCRRLHAAVQHGFMGRGHIHLCDGELAGLPENIKKPWASSWGSCAVWQSAKYRVPVGRDAMNRVMPFCQDAVTRLRLFEAYFAGFGEPVHARALQLLRTRRELAQRLGFRSWAAYELRPLSVGDPATAHELLDRCWQDAQPGLAPLLRRMEQLAATAGLGMPTARAHAGSGAASTRVAHTDEAFLRALVTREADAWRLAEFLPAGSTLPRLMEVVGRASNVSFRELAWPGPTLRSGWHASVLAYEVLDGPPGAGQPGRRLGFCYVRLHAPRRLLGRAASLPPGAMLLCPGHVYLGMNFQAASLGHSKLLSPEEAASVAHELGHAVHMLCHRGGGQEFDDLPLDVLELPSTLTEMLAMHPAVIPRYARHYASGGPPPDALAQSCQHSAHFFVRYLQSMHVALGLHGEAFDPDSATPAELREAAVALWQRYSPVEAHPSFTPLGGDAGVYLALGSHHVALLHCYLRADSILHAAQCAAGSSGARARGSVERWLGPGFAGQLRSQLLDRRFPAQRRAALLPALAPDAGSVAAPTEHPLPPLPLSASALFGRLRVVGA